MSAMNTIRFACTSLVGTNKAGIVTPDKDGYFTQVLGGLNILNSAGMHYDATSEVVDLFTNKSAVFQRRIARGVLKAEVGHPKPTPNMSEDAYFERLLTIEDKNVCAHISEVWLDDKSFKGKDGTPIIAIMGKVTGSGPHGAMMDKALNNPKENVCFSIRSFTEDKYMAGRTHRAIRNVVTFDYVVEPGIAIAEKFQNPSLESLQERVFTQSQVEKAITNHQRVAALAGLESNSFTMNDIFQSFGWVEGKKATGAFKKW